MFLLAVLGGVHIGDIIFQLITLIFLIIVVAGITLLLSKRRYRSSKAEEVDGPVTDEDNKR